MILWKNITEYTIKEIKENVKALADKAKEKTLYVKEVLMERYRKFFSNQKEEEKESKEDKENKETHQENKENVCK